MPGETSHGTLRGSPDHFDRLQTAFTDEEWWVGTAEVVHNHGEWRLHVTVTHETHRVASKTEADTIVGVAVNEDCIALVAMSRSGSVKDSVVFEYPSVKEQRHEFLTKRKRMQKAGQVGFESTVQTEEQEFVHDQLHKVSRRVVDWVSQFSAPVLVFEDRKDIRDAIDYGTRTNRRLHSLPFAALRDTIEYKAAWEGSASDEVDPEHTSQRCPRTECQHTERANRHKKRFKCQQCEFQDHADRKPAVCVVQEWLDEQETENVPSLETLPRAKKMRPAASGGGGAADSHGRTTRSGVTSTEEARASGQAREELQTVASAVPE